MIHLQRLPTYTRQKDRLLGQLRHPKTDVQPIPAAEIPCAFLEVSRPRGRRPVQPGLRFPELPYPWPPTLYESCLSGAQKQWTCAAAQVEVRASLSPTPLQSGFRFFSGGRSKRWMLRRSKTAGGRKAISPTHRSKAESLQGLLFMFI